MGIFLVIFVAFVILGLFAALGPTDKVADFVAGIKRNASRRN